MISGKKRDFLNKTSDLEHLWLYTDVYILNSLYF